MGRLDQGRRGARWPCDHARLSAAAAWLCIGAAIALLPALAAPAGAPAATAPAGDRAWELVSPSAPVNASIHDVFAIRDDGQRIVVLAMGPMPGALGGDLVSHSLSLRTESGWRTEPISGRYDSPQFEFSGLMLGPYLSALSSDFSSAVLVYASPLLPEGPPPPRMGLYRWAAGGGLSLGADIGQGLWERPVVGASGDLELIAFATDAHLLPSDAGRTFGDSVYVLEGSTISQVDVDTSGALLSSCGSSVPPGGFTRSGARIYFVNPDASGACETPSRIYLREGDGTTTEVSAPQCSGDCGGVRMASFVGATPDGSVAFFVTRQRLLDADENTKQDLYRFSAEGGGLELVSPGSASMEAEVSSSPIRASVDGSVAYFQSFGPLLPGHGSAGTNLYAADQGGVRFVTELYPEDAIEISADGRFVALSTAAALDAADTDGRVDVYRYDAAGDSFTLVSRGPAGGNGDFSATTVSSIERLVEDPVRHPFSRDGERIFFGTPERLLPEDVNEVADVYEWDGGRLGLISTGSGSHPARFAAADRAGETVVIRTAASLLPSDRDNGEVDLYAARPGGGFEAEEQPPAPACDPSCAGPDAPRAARPDPASLSARARGKGRIRLRRVGDDACRELLRSGRMTVATVVPAPGRVSAVATDRVAGERRTLLRGTAGAVRRGRLSLHLVATRDARAELRTLRRLRARLVLRQASARLVRDLAIDCGARR